MPTTQQKLGRNFLKAETVGKQLFEFVKFWHNYARHLVGCVISNRCKKQLLHSWTEWCPDLASLMRFQSSSQEFANRSLQVPARNWLLYTTMKEENSQTSSTSKHILREKIKFHMRIRCKFGPKMLLKLRLENDKYFDDASTRNVTNWLSELSARNWYLSDKQQRNQNFYFYLCYSSCSDFQLVLLMYYSDASGEERKYFVMWSKIFCVACPDPSPVTDDDDTDAMPLSTSQEK